MQILRSLPLACAAAIILSPFLVRADDDNEAQIRSRQALEQKMQEMQSQPATSTPPAEATQPTPAKPKKTKNPKPAPPPPAQPRAEEPVVSQPAPAPAKPTAHPADMPVYSAPPDTSSGDMRDEKLQQALQEKMGETQPPPSEATTRPKKEKKQAQRPIITENTTPTPAHVSTPTEPPMPSSLAPLQGPPSSLSASKQQKLDQLLQQYRADQITPAQYHEERAKILSGP